MLRLLMRWTVRAVAVALAAFALLYLGDWAVYALRRSPHSTVTVHRMAVVPLKGNKQEFVDQGSEAQACSVSLFAQDGLDACWKLRRNPNQSETF
jgi:hypothetical protein